MKPKNDVFQLIKSLTKAEKRFFNLFSSLSEGEKNYIKLFHAIDRMSEYNEVKLKKKLTGERFLNNLSYEKNYLFKMLLRALRIFHDECDAENTLHSRFMEINILNEKGMYGASRDILKRTMILADQYKKNEMKISLLQIDTELDDRTYDIKETEKNIEKHFSAVNLNLKHIDTSNRYKKLYDSFWLQARQRKEEGMNALRKLMNSPELTNFPEDGGFHAQKLFLAMNSTFNLFEGKISESLAYAEKIIQHLQHNPSIIFDQPKSYYSALHNIMGRYIYLGEEKKFFDTLEKFRSFPEKINSIRKHFYAIKIASSSIQLELEYYLKNDLPQKAQLRLPTLVSILKEYEKDIPVEHLLTLNYTAAVTYFNSGQVKETLKYIHQILNNEEVGNLRIDLQCNAKLIRICCYYDLNDTVGIELALQDLKRFVKNKRIHYESLKQFISYFTKSIRLSIAQRKKEMLVFEKKISNTIKSSEKEKSMLREVECMNWIKRNL